MLSQICHSLQKFKVLFHGQLISLLIAGTGIFSSLLSTAEPSANFPTFMTLVNYILLSTYLLRNRFKVLKTYFFNNSTENIITSRMIYLYILGALFDLEANALVIEAYNHTSITSVMLLDCFTIPCAMVLSRVFLGCRYKLKHYLGALICLIGLACIVLSDTILSSGENGSGNTLYGDVLCLMGSALYASSNVLQEYLVKFHERDAYLGIMGSFGVLFGIIQCACVDLKMMRAAHYTPLVYGSITGFVTCLFLMYVNTSTFLVQSDATLFNLSLLTSDVYAVVFSYFMYHHMVHWLYFVAFALVAVGLTLYHSEYAPLSAADRAQLILTESQKQRGDKPDEDDNGLGFGQDTSDKLSPVKDEDVDNCMNDHIVCNHGTSSDGPHVCEGSMYRSAVCQGTISAASMASNSPLGQFFYNPLMNSMDDDFDSRHDGHHDGCHDGRKVEK